MQYMGADMQSTIGFYPWPGRLDQHLVKSNTLCFRENQVDSVFVLIFLDLAAIVNPTLDLLGLPHSTFLRLYFPDFVTLKCLGVSSLTSSLFLSMLIP